MTFHLRGARRGRSAGVLLALLAPIAAAPAAFAQASLPPASTLLQRAQTAVAGARSYHLAGKGQVSLPGLAAGGFTLSGDVVPGSQSERITFSGVAGSRSVPAESFIRIGTRAWIKDAQTRGVWRTLSSLQLPVPGNVLPDPLAAGGFTLSGARTVGATTFKGKAVWQVKGSIRVYNVVRLGVVALLDRTSSRPYRLTESLLGGFPGATVSAYERFSHYGETVTIQPPVVGSSTP